MLTGPDVSEHQGSVDWGKVANDHELALVRVADGDHRDAFYNDARVKAVRRAGLLFAPYYFARVASLLNNQRDGAEEAAMVLRFAKAGGWE
jgi:GH25 family lysozyme M1 (1,4-beta-N-acetylmuramidase)